LIVEHTLKRNVFEPALYFFSNERSDQDRLLAQRSAYWILKP
jgi:hypothetical protein